MKKILFIAGSFLLMVGIANAQQSRGGSFRMNPEERAKRSVESLDRELKLTPTQKDSIYQFSLQEAKDQQGLFQGGAGDRQANFQKMRDLREKTNQKIKGVLTEEQQKSYDAVLKERQSRMGRMGGGRRGGGNS